MITYTGLYFAVLFRALSGIISPEKDSNRIQQFGMSILLISFSPALVSTAFILDAVGFNPLEIDTGPRQK